MADVIINDIYLSAIADAIRTKLGTELTYTPPNMASAIRSISGGGSSGSYQAKTVDPSTSQQIVNPDTGYDALSSVTVNAMPSGTAGTPIATKGTVSNHSVSITPSVNNTTGYIVGGKKTGTSVSVSASELVSGSQTITSNGTVNVTNLAEVVVNVNDAPTLQTVTKSYTPTESSQSETIVPGTGYDGLSEVEVTVDAISSTYVGSGIDRRSSSNLTASGATVTIPAGYYASSASKSVATGTAGTPTATKSTVSNHSISITPSVTNTTGYITGGTKSGTAVSVSASELVSGTLSVTTNGTKDVTNYASINVNISGDVPVFQDKTVTPTESEQVIEPDDDYDGLSSVTVSAIDLDYVGSGISRKDSTSLTVSGATITAPAGYYVSDASKSVSSMTLPTAASSTSSGTSKATITPSTSAQYLNIPTGYNGTASYYTVSAMPTMTLPTSAASSATSGYTSKATISRSTSDQYINIPTGYNSAGGYYKISATPNGSVTAPSSISGTTATVSTGTNTLTLTKTVSVTPNVTTAGYISAGTAGNSSVSLTASVTVDPTPTASGKTVTTPAGYYSTSTTTDVATMTLPTSASASATSGYTSKATIGRSTSDQYVNIPTGYNTAGAYYKISAVANGSATGPSSLSGTSATVSTGTNTLTLTKTGVTTTPTVSAGYVSSATASTATVTLTASVTTKAAATITPGTTNQTIAAGTYLTGTQTISGDADLVGSNILSTANIFGVQGTLVIQSYYTGSSVPSSSLGNDGDLYLQT